jgi:hypothetical protein
MTCRTLNGLSVMKPQGPLVHLDVLQKSKTLLISCSLLALQCCEARRVPQLHDRIESGLEVDTVLQAFILVDSFMQSPQVLSLVDGWYVNADGSFGFKTQRPNSPPGYSKEALRKALFERSEPASREEISNALRRFDSAVHHLYALQVSYGWNRSSESCSITLFNYGHSDEALYYNDARFLTLNATADIILKKCSINHLLPMERGENLTLWRMKIEKFTPTKNLKQ